MKRTMIQINFLLGLVIIFMASDMWAAPAPAFKCFAEYQGQQIQLAYASEKEQYMANGTLADMQIDTYDNENNCYTVEVTDAGGLISSATIPYYQDALMKVAHQGDKLSVQCFK